MSAARADDALQRRAFKEGSCTGKFRPRLWINGYYGTGIMREPLARCSRGETRDIAVGNPGAVRFCTAARRGF